MKFTLDYFDKEFEMYRAFNKGFRWWAGKLVKFGLIGACCYWVVSCHVEMKYVAELREVERKQYEACRKQLAGKTHIPILDGGFIDITKVPGFFISKTPYGGCRAQHMEGDFWWTGTELRPANVKITEEPLPAWRHFNVIARLYKPTISNKPYEVGRRTVDWPEELVVKLINYPGMEMWLNKIPPSAENEFAVTSFILSQWRRRDGTPRVIYCDGLRSPSIKRPIGELRGKILLTMNKSQLENLDFGDSHAYCTIEFHNFDFAGGDARVYFWVRSLRVAPVALKAISEHLSRSITTGK